jgi:hypothetical protein
MQRFCIVLLSGCLLAFFGFLLPAASLAQGKKKPPTKPPANQTRGTDQVKGGVGLIGETYSL